MVNDDGFLKIVCNMKSTVQRLLVILIFIGKIMAVKNRVSLN